MLVKGKWYRGECQALRSIHQTGSEDRVSPSMLVKLVEEGLVEGAGNKYIGMAHWLTFSFF